MDEWTIVTVLASLVGLFFTVGMPVIKLNSSLTALNIKLEHIQSDAAEENKRNSDGHARMLGRLDKDDERLNDHETRIGYLEHDARK